MRGAAVGVEGVDGRMLELSFGEEVNKKFPKRTPKERKDAREAWQPEPAGYDPSRQ